MPLSKDERLGIAWGGVRSMLRRAFEDFDQERVRRAGQAPLVVSNEHRENIDLLAAKIVNYVEGKVCGQE